MFRIFYSFGFSLFFGKWFTFPRFFVSSLSFWATSYFRFWLSQRSNIFRRQFFDFHHIFLCLPRGFFSRFFYRCFSYRFIHRWFRWYHWLWLNFLTRSFHSRFYTRFSCNHFLETVKNRFFIRHYKYTLYNVCILFLFYRI